MLKFLRKNQYLQDSNSTETMLKVNACQTTYNSAEFLNVMLHERIKCFPATVINATQNKTSLKITMEFPIIMQD